MHSNWSEEVLKRFGPRGGGGVELPCTYSFIYSNDDLSKKTKRLEEIGCCVTVCAQDREQDQSIMTRSGGRPKRSCDDRRLTFWQTRFAAVGILPAAYCALL